MRKIIQALVTFAILNAIYYGVFYYSLDWWASDKGVPEGAPEDTTIFRFVDEAYTLINIYTMTALIVYAIFSIRRKIRSVFALNFMNNPEERELGWLMLRSVELTNPEKHQINGDHSDSFLQRVFKDSNVSGRMFASVILPDYSRLYQLEKDREKLYIRRLMFRNQKPPLICFASKKFLYEDVYEREMAEINRDIAEQLAKPIEYSKTSFVAVDAMDHVRSALQVTAPNFITEATRFPYPMLIVQNDTNPLNNKHIHHR